MRRSKALEKMRAGKLVRTCALGHYIPAFIRHAAHFGFDCIWLDLEHRAMSDNDVRSLLGFCHQFDIDCMIRSPTLERVRLYRYLEDGAAGLMFPHVTTVADAEGLVEAAKFPPLGNRGIDGAGLDSDFYLQGGPGYTDDANRETFIVAQIESPQALDNVEGIAAVEGIDAVFIGPADLGLRLQHQDGSITMEEATKRVAAAAAAHGKAWGRPAGTPELLQELYDQGARLLAQGGEFLAILQVLEGASNAFESVESTK
jgi:4-hydroxy-2-oxoheptanedioate aldolase